MMYFNRHDEIIDFDPNMKYFEFYKVLIFFGYYFNKW